MRFRQSLFWDVDPKTIDPKKHAKYIIERVLDFGDVKEIEWMWKTYSKRLIKSVVKDIRAILPSSKKFWAKFLEIKNIKITNHFPNPN